MNVNDEVNRMIERMTLAQIAERRAKIQDQQFQMHRDFQQQIGVNISLLQQLEEPLRSIPDSLDKIKAQLEVSKDKVHTTAEKLQRINDDVAPLE